MAFLQKISELAILKNSVFLSQPFWNFCLLHPYENQSKVLGYQGWDEILMITLISSQKSPTPNISAPSVVKGDFHLIEKAKMPALAF